MLEQTLECLVDNADATRPLHVVRPSGLAAFLDSLPPAQSRFLRQLDFTAAAQELMFLPGDEGVVGAVLGLGDDTSPAAFGNLAFRLPEGAPWRLQPGDYDPAFATLGFCLGAYRYAALKAAKRGTGATAGTGAATAQSFRGRRHLDGARSREHPGQSSRPRRTRRVRRLARQASRRRGRCHSGQCAGGSLPHDRHRRPRIGATATCRDPALVGQHMRMPTRRSFRCAARASVSIPAATTSSRRAACCA